MTELRMGNRCVRGDRGRSPYSLPHWALVVTTCPAVCLTWHSEGGIRIQIQSCVLVSRQLLVYIALKRNVFCVLLSALPIQRKACLCANTAKQRS